MSSKNNKQQPYNVGAGADVGAFKTPADKLAILITNTFGNLSFLLFCILFFAAWICWNVGLIYGVQPFDRYPFPVLEMVVSIFAVILSVSVLISQNRQGRLEKIRQQVEFEVNVRAENEITKILTMLHEIQKKMGIDHPDQELEQMKQNLDLKELHQQAGDHEN